ncbi:MAG TPA: polysaccharide biosynthesis/export family protein [Anaeromyxobacter sp.]|nr:polysaccharide biosynthesis/export family protein [Anaeromyxobacter sp.]
MKIRPTGVFLLATLGLSSACRTAGSYVWAKDLPAAALAEPGYVIAPGDLLLVRVWNDETLGGRAKVRSDGRISLPFLDDVAAAGMSPGDLARALEVRLAGYVNAPRVTIALEEEKLVAVSVVGEVARPGVYDVAAGAGVLQALASAGGMTPWATANRIFVLRRAGGEARPSRIRFTEQALARAEDRSSAFRLRRGDVVVVE